MNSITLINPSNDTRWDSFVQKHPYGMIYHTASWKSVLEKSFKHMKGYYFILEDHPGGNIQAALPIYLVDSWITGKRLVSIPFATICDPLISNHDEFLSFLYKIKYLSHINGCLYIEQRAHMAAQLIQDCGLSVYEDYKNHILSLDQSLVQIEKSFHQMVRRNIAKSNRSGLIIRLSESETDLKTFYHLYFRTRKFLGLPCQPYEFFNNVHKFLVSRKMGCILLAEKNRKLACGALFLNFRDRFSYEYSAWDRTYNELRPNYLILWEAIKLAHSKSFRLFDFGRTYKLHKGLLEFKGRWGVKTIGLSKFYYPDEKIEKLKRGENSISYKVIRKLCRILPNYLYSQMGEFIYRHIG